VQPARGCALWPVHSPEITGLGFLLSQMSKDGASSWLTTQYKNGQPERLHHVLWGSRPDASQSDEASEGRNGVRPARGHDAAQTRALNAASELLNATPSAAESQADSSETPQVVVDYLNSSASNCSQSSGKVSAPDGNHILFDNDSTSDVSQGTRGHGTGSASAEDPLPSAGSALHAGGSCKPCMFAHTVVGCSNGSACDFCHFVHRRRQAQRPCKAKRDRVKAIIEKQAKEAGLPPSQGGSAATSDNGGHPGVSSAQAPHADEWERLVAEQGEVRVNAKGHKTLRL